MRECMRTTVPPAKRPRARFSALAAHGHVTAYRYAPLPGREWIRGLPRDARWKIGTTGDWFDEWPRRR